MDQFGYPVQSGPCTICGATNYALSMGGPTICPSCDCGDFGLAKVQRLAAEIARLRQDNLSLVNDLEREGTRLKTLNQQLNDARRAWRSYCSERAPPSFGQPGRAAWERLCDVLSAAPATRR